MPYRVAGGTPSDASTCSPKAHKFLAKCRFGHEPFDSPVKTNNFSPVKTNNFKESKLKGELKCE